MDYDSFSWLWVFTWVSLILQATYLLSWCSSLWFSPWDFCSSVGATRRSFILLKTWLTPLVRFLLSNTEICSLMIFSVFITWSFFIYVSCECFKCIHLALHFSVPASPDSKALASGHANPTFQLKKPNRDKVVKYHVPYE